VSLTRTAATHAVVATCAVFTVLAPAAASAQRADTIVRTASRPVHSGVATLQREISIGVADGDDHYILGAISDLAVDASGNIYIWDRSVPAIRMYDAKGKYVRTIGRSGSGPGEYRAGAGIAIARNGNLLMWDPGNARINVYSPAGEHVAAWPTKSGNSGSASGQGLFVVDTAGAAYIRTILFNRQSGSGSTSTAWIRFRPDGTLRDTVLRPVDPNEKTVTAEARGQFGNRYVPFTPHLMFELSPLGYFVSGVNDRIALDLHQPGTSIVSIRRNVVPQPVSARERDSARAEITAEMRKIVPNWSWNGADIPRVKPVYSSLTVSGDGRLWVQLAEGPGAKEDSAALGRGQMMFAEGRGGRAPVAKWACPSTGWLLFDVYDPSGQYLGQVRVPPRVDPLVMRGDLVWATTCNDDGVPSVVRYRIGWN
jgi:hypothetical protein